MNDDLKDPRYTAALDLIRRSGAGGYQIRWSGKPTEADGPPEYEDNDPVPLIWLAVADYTGEGSSAGLDGWMVAVGGHPVGATLELADKLLARSVCVHCKRPTRIDHEWQPRERDPAICWYVFDPELATYRRSCEGTASVGRNDPCVCGSGKKFKHCHGRPKGAS